MRNNFNLLVTEAKKNLEGNSGDNLDEQRKQVEILNLERAQYVTDAIVAENNRLTESNNKIQADVSAAKNLKAELEKESKELEADNTHNKKIQSELDSSISAGEAMYSDLIEEKERESQSLEEEIEFRKEYLSKNKSLKIENESIKKEIEVSLIMVKDNYKKVGVATVEFVELSIELEKKRDDLEKEKEELAETVKAFNKKKSNFNHDMKVYERRINRHYKILNRNQIKL